MSHDERTSRRAALIPVWDELCTPACAQLRAMAAEAEPSDVTAVARLRKRHSAELVHAALHLAEAHRKLERKWDAEPAVPELIADPEGAEMASGSLAAAHKAARFARTAPGARVWDLCAGIGADAAALGRAGLDVVAVDRDPLRAWMAARNAGCPVRTDDVEALLASGDLGEGIFHLDPSRRDDAGRRIRYDLLTPGPAFIEALCDGRTGAVKLPPGINRGLSRSSGGGTIEADPPPGEIEYLSERGRMTQAVLWTGELACHDVSATMLRPGRDAASISGEPDGEHACPWADVEDSAWIHTADPCVERAGLLHLLCARAGVGLAHPGTGLLCAGERSGDPMLSAFRVRAVMPWRREKVRDWLRAHDGGVVEIKTRGKAADTDQEQKALRGTGATPFTVFVIRFGQAVRAIVTERVPARR